ncbi:MAG: MFS transporter [Planctomycetota bacterium]|nr:MFS transporter [Planctomycetota bacterium]
MPDSRNQLRRIYVAGALMDYSLYLFMGVLYFFVLGLGGGSSDLGIVSAAGGACYVVAAIAGGRLSDRVPRLLLARIGCLSFSLLVFGISLCTEIRSVILIFTPVGVSMGLFWPPIQARIADLAAPEGLADATGRFNIAWSLGKGFGFFSSGVLIELFSSLGEDGALRATMAVAAIAGVLPFLLLGESDPSKEQNAPQDPEIGRRKNGRPYLLAAWISNFAVFGAGAAIVTHHPKWISDMRMEEFHSNAFLAAVFISQTGGFILWSLYTRWRYRLIEFWVVQVAFGVAIAALPLYPSFGLTLLLAPLVGLGLGLTYQASIFYSLDVGVERGRHSGLHEGILGSGNFLLPLLGGLAAGTCLGNRAPYLVAAAVVGLGLAVQVAVFWRSSRSKAKLDSP